MILEGILGELREHRKILEEHSKILEEHSTMLKDHSRLLGELKVMAGSMGGTCSRDFGKAVLSIYRDELARRGLDVRLARKFSYIDVDGGFGLKGDVFEFDVIIGGDGVTV